MYCNIWKIKLKFFYNKFYNYYKFQNNKTHKRDNEFLYFIL